MRREGNRWGLGELERVQDWAEKQIVSLGQTLPGCTAKTLLSMRNEENGNITKTGEGLIHSPSDPL